MEENDKQLASNEGDKDQRDDADDTKKSEEVNPLHGRFTFRLALASVAATLGGSTINGYNTAALNMPVELIRNFINTSLIRYSDSPSETSINLVWSMTQSIFLIGGCIGAFTFGTLAQRLGR